MKKEITITTPEDIELVHKIEALHYETEGRTRVISELLNSGYGMDTDAFRAYQSEQVLTVGAYDKAKSELLARFPEVGGRWQLDWNSMTLSYDV